MGVGEDICAELLPLHLAGVNPEVTIGGQAWQFGRKAGHQVGESKGKNKHNL